MGVEPKPFDPKTYVEEDTFVTDESGAKKRIRLENNIVRWRAVKNPDGTTSVSEYVLLYIAKYLHYTGTCICECIVTPISMYVACFFPEIDQWMRMKILFDFIY